MRAAIRQVVAACATTAQPTVALLRAVDRQWLSVPLGELRAQHMNTVLGNVWYLLKPVLQVGVYFLVFGLLLKTSRGIDNLICFLAIGVFSYGYMQKSITGCAASIVTNEGPDPLAVLPAGDPAVGSGRARPSRSAPRSA